MLEENNPHESGSHAEQTKTRLSVEVSSQIRELVTSDMRMSVTAVRRVVARDFHDVDVTQTWRVWRLVRAARRSASPIGQGFSNTDNMGDVRRYARQSTMEAMMAKHNDAQDPFHIGMHDMMVCGQEFSESSTDFSIFFTNVWFLLTAFCVMISGWELKIFTDLFHRFCGAKVKMICYGCCSLGYR